MATHAARTDWTVRFFAPVDIAWLVQKHVLDDKNWLSQLLGDAQSSAPVTDKPRSTVSASVPSVYDTNPPGVPGPYPVE